jgi:hypothetical protein
MQRKKTPPDSTTGILSTLSGYLEYIQPALSTAYDYACTGAKATGEYIASKWNASTTPAPDTKIFRRKHVEYKTNRTAGVAVRDRLAKKSAAKKSNLVEKKSAAKKANLVDKIYDAYNENKKSDDGNDELNVKLVELFAVRIKEHASRRVDLFFLLLVAVYNKQITVHKKATIKQHGEGEKYLDTHACHSSLFPHIEFESIPSRWPWYASTTPCPTLSGTHFEETSNMTMELPDIVNKFDSRLEGTLQPNASMQICLDILNKTSRGDTTPKQGLKEFLQMMNRFFEEFETKSDSMKKVCDYQKSGTFMKCDLSLLSLRKGEEIRNIDEEILQQAQETDTPLLIKTENSRFFIYGDKKGDNQWVLTEIKTEDVHLLSDLHFDKKIIMGTDKLFNQVLRGLLKQGHIHFITSCAHNEINNNYFFTMLRIFPDDKKADLEKFYSKFEEKDLEPYYQKMQDEIFSSKPVTRGLGKKTSAKAAKSSKQKQDAPISALTTRPKRAVKRVVYTDPPSDDDNDNDEDYVCRP